MVIFHDESLNPKGQAQDAQIAKFAHVGGGSAPFMFIQKTACVAVFVSLNNKSYCFL